MLPTHQLPTAAEIMEHPAYPTALWQLEADMQKTVLVGHGRRCGPLKIYYEIHGRGPIHVLLICGVAARHTAWQRQTLYFGHLRRNQYSVLLVDNRGSGFSDKPWWYSSSEMARDLVEVLDDAGWTAPRQVHVVGLSLGGMVAQELGLLVPQRIASLGLVHTAAGIEATWMDRLRTFGQVLRKKTVDETLWAAAAAMFSHEWLLAADDAELPVPAMPGVGPPLGSSSGSDVYLRFDSNYARYAAQELTKQNDPAFTDADRWAVVGHFVASALHHVSDARLRQLADTVGRARILVLHARHDAMIPARYGEHLMAVLQPERAIMRDASGHVPKLECARWFNELLAETFSATEALTKQDVGRPKQ